MAIEKKKSFQLKRMKKLLFVLFSILLSASIVYQEDQKIYRSSKYNFIINYPASWSARETSKGVSFISPPIDSESSAFVENVDIVIEKNLGYGRNMKEYLENTISTLFNPPNRKHYAFRNVKILEKEITAIGEKEAGYLIFSYELWGFPYKSMQYTIIEGSKLYIFTYAGEGEDFYRFLPEAESIIRSFRKIK